MHPALYTYDNNVEGTWLKIGSNDKDCLLLSSLSELINKKVNRIYYS